MSVTTDPEKHRDILLSFQSGLEAGVVDASQVVAWVDMVIANDPEIHPFFADLALAGHDVNRLLSVFGEHLGAPQQPIGYRVLLGALYWRIERKEIAPADVRSRLVGYLYTVAQVDDEERYRLFGSEDALSLALDGIHGTVDDAMHQLKEDLSIYSGFLVEHPELWSSASASVDAVLRQEHAAREARAARSAKVQVNPPRKKP